MNWLRRTAVRSTANCFQSEMALIENLGLCGKSRGHGIAQYRWRLPAFGIVKGNVDGAAKGNPGLAGLYELYSEITVVKLKGSFQWGLALPQVSAPSVQP